MDLFLLLALIVEPLLGSAACLVMRSPAAVLWVVSGFAVGEGALALASAACVFASGAPVFAASQWLFLDSLSALNIVVMSVVFAIASIYAHRYFAPEVARGQLTLRGAHQFGALFGASLSAMALVLVSNHLAIMWIGIEATTLFSAFLICLHVTPTSLEAMWKTLLVCSVGVAFAFVGTLLVEVSALKLHPALSEGLLWTSLRERATELDPSSLRVAFVFLLVGYGTKAGLAPMHSWLPDAHSQAPAPVPAISSGFMLNAALYCVMRYVPIVEGATGHGGFSTDLLSGFGLLSIGVAGAFIVFQKDLKRLLAYSSVEHVGIMAVGLGLGVPGAFAALLHTLNHAVGKPLAFFCAGKLGQERGTHEIGVLAGSIRRSPVWGAGLFASLLALFGVAPFGMFMSELAVMRAAVQARAFVTLGLFAAGCAVVFVGGLRHALGLAWGEPTRVVVSESEEVAPPSRFDLAFVVLLLGVLLSLGLFLPPWLTSALEGAARVIGGSR